MAFGDPGQSLRAFRDDEVVCWFNAGTTSNSPRLRANQALHSLVDLNYYQPPPPPPPPPPPEEPPDEPEEDPGATEDEDIAELKLLARLFEKCAPL